MDPDTLAALMAQASMSPSRVGTSPPELRKAPPQYRHGMTDNEFAQYIQDYKDWVNEDSKLPPTRPPYLDRNRLIAEQVRYRSELEEHGRRSAAGVPFIMSVVGYPKHSSSTPLENLSPSTSHPSSRHDVGPHTLTTPFF